MKRFVDEVHDLGMKFVIWFSVPYVGFKSKNFERFKDMYLTYRNHMNAAVLDPRYKEVRDFLCDTYATHVENYGWDGLKLDFIDTFRLTDTSPTNYEDMDTVSVEDAVNKLLSEITEKLRAINPEFLIEFRQSYVGPAIVQYGNMLRATDCPNDAILNRVHTLHLRMTSAGIPVHSDMLMWSKNDTVESVVYQLLACMYSVPQISILFDNITDEHKRALKAFLDFWREHRDTILDSELELFDAEANFSMARAFNEKECVCVQYQQVVAPTHSRTTHIFNASGKDGVYVELDTEREYEIYTIYGEKRAQGRLGAGVHRIDAKNCERVSLF
jgi:alpha-galactosidase